MIKRLNNSLTAKIFLITTLMLVVMSVLTYAFIAWVMPLTYSANLNSRLSIQAEQLAEQLEQSDSANCQAILDQFSRSANADVYIVDNSNRTVLSSTRSGSISTTVYETTTDNGSDYSPFELNKTVENYSVIAAAGEYQFQFLSDDNTYNLIITVDMQAVNQATEALRQVFPWLIIAVLVISLLGALYYSRYITQPVVKLSVIAKKMSNLEFDWHCDDNRSDEIGLLGNSLNELAEKLSEALADLQETNLLLQKDIDRERELERQRLEFFSAVSHELKTPITVIKGQLEGMLKNIGVYKDHETYLAKCLSVTCVMENMVQEILTITRMESSSFIPQFQSLDFSALVQKQLEIYREFMEQKYLCLQTNLISGLMVSGDDNLLQKAVSNLLCNAIRYSPAEETIFIRVYQEKDKVILSIENTGIHIPEESIPYLFEAFYRVEQSRNRQTGGSGLGLYLVSRIATLHGTECRLENFEKGVRALLSVPLI